MTSSTLPAAFIAAVLGLAMAGLALPAIAAAGADAGTAADDGAPPANAQKSLRHATRAAVPAGNFLVEWRIQPVNMAPRGAVVITSSSAGTGGVSGYGPGAVVVGTARAQLPQSVRVSNGKEGAIRFDDAETHTAYDMSYAAESSSESSTGASSQSASSASGSVANTTGASKSRSQSQDRGASGHDVVVHRVHGLRVTPHWTQGDTLQLDVQLVHEAPSAGSGMSIGDARASRGVDFHSTVELSFDEWQSVATVGDGSEELQVRVSWR